MPTYIKNEDQVKEILCKCSCMNLSHIVSISYHDDDWDCIYISYTLNDLPWYQRIWEGLKYMAGIKDSMFHEVVLQPKDADEIVRFLKEYQRADKSGKAVDIKHEE